MEDPKSTSNSNPGWRPALLVALALVLIFSLAAVWIKRREEKGRRVTLSGLINNNPVLSAPTQAAKEHLTGGIGITIRRDAATGLPAVDGVRQGSPAAEAGVQSGDLILEVNGESTAPAPFGGVLENIKGVSGTNVRLLLKTRDGTKRVLEIRRGSWKQLDALPLIRPPKS